MTRLLCPLLSPAVFATARTPAREIFSGCQGHGRQRAIHSQTLRTPPRSDDRRDAPTYDVVVVGSGASGLTAATLAASKGARVLVVEKSSVFGGTTAYSGGGLWIPCNRHQPELGIIDSRAEAEKYLRKVVNGIDDEKLAGFLDSGPRMVEWIEEHTKVKFQGVPLPDYCLAEPGASIGRTLLTRSFDGRQLGGQIRNIRSPLRGFTALGSMQADTSQIVTLTQPFSSAANFTFSARRIIRYALDLIFFGKGTELYNGNALVGGLYKSACDLGVEFWKESSALSPILGDGVEGLAVSSADGKQRLVNARLGVVLASGGLGRSFASQSYVPHEWSAASRDNTGDGIAIAVQAGAEEPPPNKDNAIFAPISLLHQSEGTVERYPHFGVDRAKPGSIIVGQDGKRFANESEPYQDLVRTMHQRRISKAYFIADQKFLKKYGMGMALPWPHPNGRVLRRGYLLRSSTIAGLAKKIEVDSHTLEDTVSRFNDMMKKGVDEDFHRGDTEYDRFYGDPGVHPNPSHGTCTQGPFFALPLVPGNVSITWGVTTNKDAQVLDQQQRPIRGLYAVGCDQNSIMKGNYPGGGSSIGPGMTFGFRAAEHIMSTSTR